MSFGELTDAAECFSPGNGRVFFGQQPEYDGCCLIIIANQHPAKELGHLILFSPDQSPQKEIEFGRRKCVGEILGDFRIDAGNLTQIL